MGNIVISYDLAWAEDDVVCTKEKKELVIELKKLGFECTDSDYSYIGGRDIGYVEYSLKNILVHFFYEEYEENGSFFGDDSIYYGKFCHHGLKKLWTKGQKFNVKSLIKKIKKLLD